MGYEGVEQQQRSHFGGNFLLMGIAVLLISDTGRVGDIENSLIDQVDHLRTSILQIGTEFLIEQRGNKSPEGDEQEDPLMVGPDLACHCHEEGQQADDRSDQESEQNGSGRPSQDGN